MTRYAMVVDLNRCVGCQTCTAACKHANATSPGVQWRRVLDIEAGEFPDVRRAFVPVGCMHCDDPPCVDVCPSTATRKRSDGLVTIDYDLCIGCAYCAVACPYQARYKVERPRYAYGGRAMTHERAREQPERIGVAQKCTFCLDRIDTGLANGLVPGVAPDATPACAASCIAEALTFGDLHDPASRVSRLLETNKHFRMHEELGTGPNLYYLWERTAAPQSSEQAPAQLPPPRMVADGAAGIAPWHQTSWDWRAAANFMAGGAGTGLLAAAALATPAGMIQALLVLLALAFIGAGLFCVWLEIGRPWRFLNVLFHPGSSWMTREAMTAVPLFALGLLAAVVGPPWSMTLASLAAAVGLGFLYCQARILQAARGIPAWRTPAILPLVVTTGLAEGAGIFLAISAILPATTVTAGRGVAGGLAVLLALRFAAWRNYLRDLGTRGAPARTLGVLDTIRTTFEIGGHLVPMGLLVAGWLAPVLASSSFAIAGLLAFAAGWLLKYTVVARAAFNQGYAIARFPARGNGTSAPGIKPGWTMH